MFQTPYIEYRSRTEIKRFQEDKLAEMLAYVSGRSPFYRRMFQEHRVSVAKIKTMEDLRNIPFTTKQDLQLYNDDFLCVSRENVIDYITTSGTLGVPATFAMTDADLERLAYNEQISFACAGAKKGDIFQLMTTIDKRFMAGLAYFLGIRKLGAGVIRVGNGIAELQWDTIKRIKPNVAVVVPSFILKLIKYAEENDIDYKNSSIKKLVCIGENLRECDFSLNLLGQTIKNKWDVELYSTYASTEMATSFTECDYGCGGHHHPELIVCELIDANGQLLPEGEIGELVITTLGVEGMPLLRFRTGDLARFHTEPCKCGRTAMRISPIVGRLNHLIKYKGTTLYPPSIFDVLDNVSYLENYLLEVFDNECGNDDVLVKVGLREYPGYDVVKDLKDRFRARIRVAPEIEICSADMIKAVIMPDISRKPMKFFDKRRKK